MKKITVTITMELTEETIQADASLRGTPMETLRDELLSSFDEEFKQSAPVGASIGITAVISEI